MEEAKAAAYYDELVHKGEGAARFKQGLGYSSHSYQQLTIKSNTQSSLSNFVKAASPGRAIEIEKEIRVENIRDKLKKKDEIVLEPRKRGDVVNSRLKGREGREDVSVEKGRQRSPSSERLKGKSHEGNQRYRRRRYSHSSSPNDERRRHISRSPGRGSARHNKSWHRRNYSQSNRSTSSDGSGEERHCQHHRRVRHRPSSRSSRESYDTGFTRKRRRGRGRSSSESEEGDRSPPFYSYRRGRSRSPAYQRDRAGRRKGRRSRSSSLRRERTKKEESPSSLRNRKRNESSFVRGENKKEEAVRRNANIKERGAEIDYSNLIDGYASMTPAERVKAKMRLQLLQTVVKDSSKGMSGEWERFDFNKEAPLDDDAKLDYFGDDTGAKDDTGFLRNTGTTFFSSASQANKEAQIQAAHEAAIFGTCMQPSSDAADLNPKIQSALRDDEKNMIEGMIKSNAVEKGMIKSSAAEDKGSKGNVLGNSVISEQVYTKQQGSWRDRARKLREERVDATKS